jgi:uncharacterized membrane protein
MNTPTDNMSGAVRDRGEQMTRIETFVDAAFAFAVTLLVISVGQVPSDIATLKDAFLSVPGFAMSFAIITVFWYQHHRWSRRYGLDDGVTVVLSLILVFLVLVYVYPLRIMAEWVMHALSLKRLPATLEFTQIGDVVFVYVIYGLGFLALSMVLGLLHLHAWRLRDSLDLSAQERIETRVDLLVMAYMGVVAVTSTLLALALPVDRWP